MIILYQFIDKTHFTLQIYNSNATHVFLSQTDLRSEGTYACEVSTDLNYKTIRSERQMKVYGKWFMHDKPLTIFSDDHPPDDDRAGNRSATNSTGGKVQLISGYKKMLSFYSRISLDKMNNNNDEMTAEYTIN